MKKYIIIFVAIIAVLAFLLPFVSSSPDGLEKVIESSGVQEQDSTWNGLMSDYTVNGIDNPYLSTFLSGIIGSVAVLATAFLVIYSLSLKKKREANIPQ